MRKARYGAVLLCVLLAAVGFTEAVTVAQPLGDPAQAIDDAARVGTAVGDPVELTVTSPADARGRVTVEVVVEAADGGDLTDDDVGVLIEAVAGSGEFIEARVRERRGVLTAQVGGRNDGDPVAHRAHVAALVRGDFVVSLRLVRDRNVIAETGALVRASSRFDQIGLLPLNTEIVDVTSDGTRLVSIGGGFADVSDPRNPVLLPSIDGVGTASVAMTADDRYALYVGNDNDLDVVDISVTPAARVRTLDLPGDADSVATSGDGRFAAAAFGPEGGNGGIAVIDTGSPDPAAWTVHPVEFDGSDPRFAGGTAAEYVAFGPSPGNLIAGAFQGANTVALVDPASLTVLDAFSLGAIPDPFTGDPVTFDPDGIGFAPDGNLLTANEGRTRSFAAFSTGGELLFDSGIELLELAARHALDTEDPQFEEVDAAVFPDGETFIFAGMERTMSVAIYEASSSAAPVFSQFARLDSRDRTDGRPEGIAVATEAGLVFVANEDDDSISILQRTSDVRGGLPAPRQGVQPTSPATPWTVLQEMEELPDGTFLAAGPGYGNGRQLAGIHRVRFDGEQAVVVDRLPLDVPDGDLNDSGAVGGATLDPGSDDLWVALNRPQPRVALVAADGSLRRTIPLGEDARNVTGLLASRRGDRLFAVTENGHFLSVDVTTGAVSTVQTNLSFQSLFELPDGGIGTTFGDGRVELQVRRLAPGPAGGLAIAMVADRPAGLFSGARRFAANDIIAVGRRGDAVVLWSNDGSEDGYTTRLVAVDDLLEGALDRKTPSVSLVLPGAPMTVPGAGSVAVELTTDRPGGVLFETRPTGSHARHWTATPGTVPDGFVAGTASLELTAPVLDGTYDVRARFVSAGGRERVTAPMLAALIVDTPPATEVTLSRPRSDDPAFTAAGGPFRATLQVDRAGTFGLLAKPAGTPDSEYAPLTVLGGDQISGSTDVQAIAPPAEAAPGGSLAYDLRLVFRAGGDGEPVVADQAAALQVSASGPATITLTAPTPGETFQAGDSVSARFTTDEPGFYDVYVVPPDGSPPRLVRSSEADRPGEYSVFIDRVELDGGWDIVIHFTNLAGAVTELTFSDAIVVDTRDTMVDIVSPTADQPITLPLFDGRGVSVRFTKSGPGLIEIGVRPAGSTGDFVVVQDGNYTGSGPGPDFVFEQAFAAAALAPGTYDLQVAFTNALGARAEDVELAAVIGLDDPPTLNVMEPTTANPVRSLPGGAVPTWAATNFSYYFQQLRVQVRPTGTTHEWTNAGLDQFPQQSLGATFTAPTELGTYDVRYALSIPQESTAGPFVYFEELAALDVTADGPGVHARNANTFHPLRLNPGAQPELWFHGVQAGAYLAQYRPTGTGDDAWIDIAPFTISPDEVATVPFAVPADLAPGAYDLRAIDIDDPATTGAEYQQAGLIIGPTSQAPVVINELGRHFIELRNVTTEPVDVGGWGLTQCFAGQDHQLAAIPPGTSLASGDLLLVGNSSVPFLFPDAPPIAVNLGGQIGQGAAVHDAAGQLVDSVSFDGNDTNRCRELAASPPINSSDHSITRDAAGTDTGDNSIDFAPSATPTPGITA